MTPEHKTPLSWQARHIHATVAAGPEVFHAQAPYMLAFGPARISLEQAQIDADTMQCLFDGIQPHQITAVAQAMQSVYCALIDKEREG